MSNSVGLIATFHYNDTVLRTIFILFLFLLCRCATKHQPQVFSSYFPSQPEDYFSSSIVDEIGRLEEKGKIMPLTTLEKKRLFELSTFELKQLKTHSTGYKKVAGKLDLLRPDLEALQSELNLYRLEIERETSLVSDKANALFENKTLKKEYQQAYRSWNQDDNEAALNKVDQIISQPELQKLANHQEWAKILNLRFRIIIDLGKKERLFSSYQELQKHDPCTVETAQAGFLVALQAFTEGDSLKALSLFQGQCDRDDSLSNRMKRSYWLYRFQEKDPVAAQKALKIFEGLPLPGYYSYLIKNTHEGGFSLPINRDSQPSYLVEGLSVSAKTHLYLSKAEECLRVNLRKDASLYLLKAIHEMKGSSSNDFLPLLYVASLFRACGNHLESMKIYSTLMGFVIDANSDKSLILRGELAELFPRPFASTVDFLSKNWGVDSDFVYSIMRQESAFNPGAVSSADARGLMQLMPALGRSLSAQWKTEKLFQDKLLFKSDENLKYSVFHLAQLQSVAPHYALMAASYNAGINRVSKWWKRFGHLPLDVFVELIPISETRNYVKLVLRNFLYYKALRLNGTLGPGAFAMELPPLVSVQSSKP